MDDYITKIMECCQQCILGNSYDTVGTVDREFILLRNSNTKKLIHLKDDNYYSFFFYEDKSPVVLLKSREKYHILSLNPNQIYHNEDKDYDISQTKREKGEYDSVSSLYCGSHNAHVGVFTFGMRLLRLKINKKNCFNQWKNKGIAEEIEKLNQNALFLE